MNIQMLELIVLLWMHKIMIYFFFLTVLGLNMFLKKIKNLLEIKAQKQTHLEYKQIIQ